MESCIDCNNEVNIDCKKKAEDYIRKVDMETYLINPSRYQLRNGSEDGAPKCPYGNNYKWIGYDLESEEYVRFTTSVFKILIQNY
jgi:hypothetical protein